MSNQRNFQPLNEDGSGPWPNRYAQYPTAAMADCPTHKAVGSAFHGYVCPCDLSLDQPSPFSLDQQGNNSRHNQSFLTTHQAQGADSFAYTVPGDEISSIMGPENQQQAWHIPEKNVPFQGFHSQSGDGRSDICSTSPLVQPYVEPVPSISQQCRPHKKRKTKSVLRPVSSLTLGENEFSGATATDSRKPQGMDKGPSRAQTLDQAAITACEALFAKHGREIPPRKRIEELSKAFDVDLDSMLHWFHLQEDSGYQTNSMRAADLKIALRYRHFQPCHRKTRSGKQMSSKGLHLPCASRGCGIMSRNKGDWKRHEKQHWPPKIWICRCTNCIGRLGKEHVWVRGDKFRDHLRLLGKDLNKRELDSKAVSVDSHFSRECHSSTCRATYDDFDKRCNHIFDTHVVTRDRSEWREPEKTCACGINPSKYIGEDSCSDSNSETSSGDEDQSPQDPSPGDGAGSSQDHTYGSNRLHGGNDAQQPNFGSQSVWYSYNQQRLPTQSIQRVFRGRFLTPLAMAPEMPIDQSASSLKRVSSSRQLNGRHVIHSGYLGYGGSARVDELRFSDPSFTLARKTIQCPTPDEKRRAMREILVMSRLNHPHIVRFLAARMERRSVQIFMEPVADYSLSQLLFTPLESCSIRGEASFWFSCLANALHYLHESGIRHLDIKPSNILIFNSHIYIADFGTSNFVDETKSISSESEAVTRRYAAPEIWRGERGRASDIFALGCVYLELLVALLRRSSHWFNLFDCDDSRRKNHVSTYSGSLSLVAEQIAELRRFASSSGNVAFFNLALDCCYAAINSDPKERPTAADLARLLAPQSCYHSPVQAQLTPIGHSATSTIHPSDTLDGAHVPAPTNTSDDGTESSCSFQSKPSLAMFGLSGVAGNEKSTPTEGWTSAPDSLCSITSSLEDPQKVFPKEYNLLPSEAEAIFGRIVESDLDSQFYVLQCRITSSPEYQRMLSTTAYKAPILQVAPNLTQIAGSKSTLHFWLEDFSSSYEGFLGTGCSER